ncbi:MAG: hypothetical protein P4N60_16590 [Verrucomicrobiae bacterium]|nr:hypothetical protein [Verrucomicrobiae bacterium]
MEKSDIPPDEFTFLKWKINAWPKIRQKIRAGHLGFMPHGCLVTAIHNLAKSTFRREAVFLPVKLLFPAPHSS